MSGKFSMDDYVDVAERIRQFYSQHPEGSLKCGSPPQIVEAGGKPFVMYHAQAFRHPDDPLPSDGWAWEPVPGPTQFTKDSELMNAETAAWGRAIVALGFETKKIASRQEVTARQPAAPTSLAGGYGESGGSVTSTPDSPGAADSLSAVMARLAELDQQTDWPTALDKTAREQYREPGGLAKLTKQQRDHLAGRMVEHADKLAAALAESAGEPKGASEALDVAQAQAAVAPSPAEQSPFKAPAGPRGVKAKEAA